MQLETRARIPALSGVIDYTFKRKYQKWKAHAQSRALDFSAPSNFAKNNYLSEVCVHLYILTTRTNASPWWVIILQLLNWDAVTVVISDNHKDLYT